ncbi:MAG TPA: M14 metallopeptidase family protein [Puia sp.]|nr:M14 metallopeptidase family protein [Puia sp.]
MIPQRRLSLALLILAMPILLEAQNDPITPTPNPSTLTPITPTPDPTTLIPNNPNIPTPKSQFGFNIGDNYQLATYTQTEAYFSKLATSSDRAKLVVIGTTEEGRDQVMLIISSPANIKQLDRYKTISQRLAHAEGLTPEQAHALAAEGKAVVWIDGGLHATEVVATHQLIETAYQLVSREDPETRRILDNVIILLTHANPDGQELVSNWYMRNPIPEHRSLDYVPRLWEKYAGHDNNRDFYMLNLKETRNLARQLFVEWIPQIMYNHHQAGPAGSILAGPPYRDPFNYVFDPLVMTSLDAVGAAMVNRLNVEGKPGYTERSGSVYSTWYNGGLRTTTYFHNMVGLLTEIIGGPNPSEVPLVPQRLIPSGSTPFPVTPQKWLFRQSIDYSVSLNYAVLDYACRYRDEMLFNIYQMGRNSIQRGSEDYWTLSPKRIDQINQLNTANSSAPRSRRNSDSNRRADSTSAAGEREGQNLIPTRFFDSVLRNPANRDARGYILPSDQPDFATATRFINALIGDGIEVQKATAAFIVEGKSYPAGSWIVKTDQAFRPHVLDLFEPQDHPNDFAYPGGPPIPPYDAAGWTLAYTMGVRFDRILDGFDGPFERIPYGELQPTILPSPKDGRLDARSNASYMVVNDLLQAGKTVYRNPANGDFYTGHAPRNAIKIRPARIALWDTYGGSMPSGWIRLIMEQYHFPAKVIYAKDIDSGDLRSKYDIIVFVGGAIPSITQPGANQTRESFFRREPNPDSIPVEFRSHLGRITTARSIPELKKFLEAGGHIVTIGSSANLAYQLDLPVHDALVELVGGKERRLPTEKYYIPGSVLRVTLDTTIQPAWGMTSTADVYFDNSPVFNIDPAAYANGTIHPIAWFADDHPLRSGWAWGQAYLRNGVAAFVASVGQGKLYTFGPEITFRAQTHGTFKLLFNQLYTMQ